MILDSNNCYGFELIMLWLLDKHVQTSIIIGDCVITNKVMIDNIT